jgi:hypothetical protein
MIDSNPTPPRQGSDTGTAEVSFEPASRNRNGLWHDLARWSLGHPKLCTTLAVLGFVAFCGWNTDGVYHVSVNGEIFMKGPRSSPAVMTITKPVTITAIGGAVTIGQ